MADQQRNIVRRRRGPIEQQVDQTGGEREAEVDVERIGDRRRQAGQQRMQHVQREGDKHEREFQRLGDAGEEGGEPGRRQDPDGSLALHRVRHVDHREGRGGQPEHQDRIEARGEVPAARVARREASELTRDSGNDVGIAVYEPDVDVEDVVQADRDQHPVGEAVDERAERPGATDESTHSGQTGVEQRIQPGHAEGDQQHRQRDHDRYESATAEEAEVGRQLDLVVAVEQPRGHQPDHDATQDAVVDRLVPVEHHRRHRLEDTVEHEVAGQSRQRGRAVGLLGEADGHADREQQTEVGVDRTACRAHRVEERADHRRVDAAEQVILSEA